MVNFNFKQYLEAFHEHGPFEGLMADLKRLKKRSFERLETGQVALFLPNVSQNQIRFSQLGIDYLPTVQRILSKWGFSVNDIRRQEETDGIVTYVININHESGHETSSLGREQNRRRPDDQYYGDPTGPRLDWLRRKHIAKNIPSDSDAFKLHLRNIRTRWNRFFDKHRIEFNKMPEEIRDVIMFTNKLVGSRKFYQNIAMISDYFEEMGREDLAKEIRTLLSPGKAS